MIHDFSPATAFFTSDELSLLSDSKFFRAKARVMKKVKAQLETLHGGLQEELRGVDLLAPEGFDAESYQFVKGEHLEDFPYQYLDYPKHFSGGVKFTFRSLFWWGHHYVFALILEGGELTRYKQNLMNRYEKVADRGMCLCLGGSPWEWKRGEGYTMDLTWERKVDVTALLSNRSFVKLARFVPFDDPAVTTGRIPGIGRATMQDFLPIITP
jgi:hypothetical protein